MSDINGLVTQITAVSAHKWNAASVFLQKYLQLDKFNFKPNEKKTFQLTYRTVVRGRGN